MNIRVRAIFDDGANEKCHKCLTPQLSGGKWSMSFNIKDIPNNWVNDSKGEAEVVMPKGCRLLGLPIKWVNEE